MKNLKKIGALIVATMLVLAMAVPAMAEVTSGNVGGTGSITVLNATKGHTYTAYKVFDASFDGDKVSYKVLESLVNKVDTDYFSVSSTTETIGGNKYYTVYPAPKLDENDQPVTPAENAKTDAEIIAWIEAHYSDFDAAGVEGVFDATNSTVTFANLPYGYYYITSSLGTTVTIDSNTPTQDVYDKNETTPEDPVKKIVSVDGTAMDSLTADAHIGSVIGFKVTAKTNNWYNVDWENGSATQRQEWTMTDKPTNMTINESSISVTFGGKSLTKDTDYEVVMGSDGSMTITVDMVDEDGNSIYAADKGATPTADGNGLIPIEITYTATIDATAGASPATNEIPGDNPPPPTVIYTYAYMVKKTDGADQPLEGAEFELWSNKGDSSATAAALKFIDNLDGTYTYSEAGTVTTLKMTKNNKNEYVFVVKGLDNAWSYTLKEVTVPTGYNQAADIDIPGTEFTQVTKTETTSEGTTTTTITDTTINSTDLKGKSVKNNQGAELPATGGMGTRIFYIVGAILALGAGIVLVTRRRAGDR